VQIFGGVWLFASVVSVVLGLVPSDHGAYWREVFMPGIFFGLLVAVFCGLVRPAGWIALGGVEARRALRCAVNDDVKVAGFHNALDACHTRDDSVAAWPRRQNGSYEKIGIAGIVGNFLGRAGRVCGRRLLRWLGPGTGEWQRSPRYRGMHRGVAVLRSHVLRGQGGRMKRGWPEFRVDALGSLSEFFLFSDGCLLL